MRSTLIPRQRETISTNGSLAPEQQRHSVARHRTVVSQQGELLKTTVDNKVYLFDLNTITRIPPAQNGGDKRTVAYVTVDVGTPEGDKTLILTKNNNYMLRENVLVRTQTLDPSLHRAINKVRTRITLPKLYRFDSRLESDKPGSVTLDKQWNMLVTAVSRGVLTPEQIELPLPGRLQAVLHEARTRSSTSNGKQ